MAQSSRTLIGRDAELASLVTLLGVGSPDGPRRHIVLSGDAGVGKTRLLAELCDRAERDGWQAYVGHCLDFDDSAIAYMPFSEVLDRLVVDLPDVVAGAATAYPTVGRLRPVRRLLGADGPTVGELADRTALFEAVHALFEEAAEKAPFLLVIEDAHWADQSTRDLLTFLLSRPFDCPVAVVVSYRADDLHRRHPLRKQVAEWGRLPGVERLALGPLDDDSVRDLVDEVSAGMSLAEREEIVRRAEGNAFFVEELAAAASGPDRRLPEELTDVLLVRLDRLDDRSREVVRTASVSGRRVTHQLLAAVTGLDDTELEEALRHAVELNILVPDQGRYVFRHALLAEAVYDDLLPGERVRLNARYAAVMQEVPGLGTAAELARHARRALNLPLALTASVQAGDEASAVGGPDEAAQHYQVALTLANDPTTLAAVDVDVPGLVVKAAEALTLSGQPERAAALAAEQLDHALQSGADVTDRARVMSARAEALFVTESGQESLELSGQAVALLPEDAPVVVRARMLATHGRILEAYDRPEEAQAVALDALAIAERHNLQQIASEAVMTLSRVEDPEKAEGLRDALTEAVARAEEAGAIHAELRGRFFLGRFHEDRGEYAEARRWFAGAVTRAEDAGIPWAPYGADARWQLLWLHVTLGHWDEAVALCSARRAPAVMQAVLDAVVLGVRQARGEAVANEVAALRRHWREEGGIVINAASLEIVEAVRRGDVAGVLAAYDDAVRTLAAIWHPWFSARVRLAAQAVGGVADLLPTVAAADRPGLLEQVDRLADDGHSVLSQYADPSGQWGPEGHAWAKRLDAEVHRARWLGGGDAPEQEALVESWRECEQRFVEFGHVYELARVRTALASILRATGDLAGAREAADLARETARSLGARPLLDELRALGSAPVRGSIESTVLTPRETEILALVAAGRSNGEIARQLFISTKTVSVHVSNILGKLGAAGRTEAAAIARRRGLIETG
ncbi:helix-turn-helix transcriptional regulator [Nocardioides cheoyonin]|uniref:helix-turn-helix transcriptional regulator n=1 Tax=Nocardioides cheoyonin TaxID=3156615 RepID=UPI0032B4F011